MFEKFIRMMASNRLAQEQLYEAALQEMTLGQIRNGLWAKALADSDGDEQKVTSLYLKYRVQSMLDETEMSKVLTDKALLQKQNADYKNMAINGKTRSNKNSELYDISAYKPLHEFSRLKSVGVDELIQLIVNGNYKGGLFQGRWYVHKSEFKPSIEHSQKKLPENPANGVSAKANTHQATVVKDTAELGKLKSAIMRDEVNVIKQVFSTSLSKELFQHLSELIELADLFDSIHSKSYLLSCKDAKGKNV